jgi:hypothetical protein
MQKQTSFVFGNRKTYFQSGMGGMGLLSIIWKTLPIWPAYLLFLSVDLTDCSTSYRSPWNITHVSPWETMTKYSLPGVSKILKLWWPSALVLYTMFPYYLVHKRRLTPELSYMQCWNFCGFCVKVLYLWTAGRMLHTRGPIARVMSCTGTNRRASSLSLQTRLKP